MIMCNDKNDFPHICGQVAYLPKILRNLSEICDEMGVGEKTVKKWVENGAPIAVEGNGCKTRYSTEALRLQLWCERMATASPDR